MRVTASAITTAEQRNLPGEGLHNKRSNEIHAQAGGAYGSPDLAFEVNPFGRSNSTVLMLFD